jgi:hypothetical protein
MDPLHFLRQDTSRFRIAGTRFDSHVASCGGLSSTNLYDDIFGAPVRKLYLFLKHEDDGKEFRNHKNLKRRLDNSLCHMYFDYHFQLGGDV